MRIVREREFDCVECGRHIIQLPGDLDTPALCACCMTIPGWYNDPELRKLLGPDDPEPEFDR